jgi:D-alanyl-lipoteichoic acid acyltransferase DltB (MBOAT superfamily)
VYFALPQTVRWVFLLLSSYFFYGFWQIEFAGLMLFTSVVDRYCAQRLFHAPSRLGKQFWMWLAIGSDLAMLFAFKYFDFALGKSPVAQSL